MPALNPDWLLLEEAFCLIHEHGTEAFGTQPLQTILNAKGKAPRQQARCCTQVHHCPAVTWFSSYPRFQFLPSINKGDDNAFVSLHHRRTHKETFLEVSERPPPHCKGPAHPSADTSLPAVSAPLHHEP